MLAHVMIDPRVISTWVEYNTKIASGDRPNRLTEEVALEDNRIVDDLLQWTRTVATDVSNTLKATFPQLFNSIAPELGIFIAVTN